MSQAHRIVMVGFPPVQLLDIAGPLEVFSIANDKAEASGGPPPYELIVAAARTGPLASTAGVPLFAAVSVYAPIEADTLLLAGGRGARQSVRDTTLMEALARWCEQVPRVGSICTGAFPLAATGVLRQRRATTHWAHFDEFAGLFPDVRIERDALFVCDGKFHTAAGISAGIDFALALVEADLGRRLALEVARELVVFLKRPGGQSQFSAQLAAEVDADDPSRFAELIAWMTDHLAEDLSLDRMAERLAMSPRNFSRRFAAAMKTTPARYVQQLRVDAARRLLTDSDLPVARVAARCGFASAEAMRLAFQRHLRIAPQDFRARFQSAGRTGADD
ncbi:GlxA family transcriptional regulator [Chitinimonas lacunae]|uniref:GlxA family transcriptional regulator n=1 Tax=Chitinimonas lacunae TaxID=1963018 RepID=A0ABV8MUD2_9NEIS